MKKFKDNFNSKIFDFEVKNLFDIYKANLLMKIFSNLQMNIHPILILSK